MKKKKNMRKMGKIVFIIIFIFAILSINSHESKSENNAVFTDKAVYDLGEIVSIKTNFLLQNTSVTIILGNEKYSLIGNSNIIEFVPEKTGHYLAEMRDKIFGSLLGTAEFDVINTTILNQFGIGKSVKIDKESYFLGDKVNIMVLGSIVEYELSITTNNKTYQLIGGLKEDNTFYPQEKGNYIISLFDNENKLISSASFNVKERVTQEKIKSKIYGMVDAVCIESTASFTSFENREGTIRIWYTNDGKKTPILMDLALPIGNIRFELDGIKEGNGHKT